MMTKRKKLIILLIVLALIFLLVLLLFLRTRPSQEPTPAPVVVPVIEEPVIIEPEPSVIVRELAEEREETNSIQTLGKTFVERYGSYSNEAEFENLRDLYPIMTQSFISETADFIETTIIPDSYYGVTTQVIIMSVDSFDESLGIAQMTITTQREEAIDSPQNINVRYQDVVVNFELLSGSWKISSAKWQ